MPPILCPTRIDLPAGEPPEDITERIEQVTSEYLRELQQNRAASIEQLAAAHPDLAPHLEARLRLCRAIFLASRKTPSTEVDDNPTVDFDNLSPSTQVHPFAFRIRCPHCGRQVQVIDDQAPEVTCQSCGSSVKVSSRPKQRPMSAPPMPEKLGHFQILRTLGEGGFGIVYLARDANLDRSIDRSAGAH